MSKIRHTPNTRFITHLIKKSVSTCLLTDRLIVLAEDAYASRNKIALAKIGAEISRVSVDESVGEFYSALALSQADRARADKVLESVAERSPSLYRAKALLALGSHHQSDGDIIAALELYQDAERLGGQNSLVRLYTGENRAIIESARGNHKRALAGFQASAQYATGANLFNNLNSQAEELKNLGRHTEAARLSALCMSSPYASAYPEWRDTALEIHPATRSQVYLPSVKISARVDSRALALMSDILKFKSGKPPHRNEAQKLRYRLVNTLKGRAVDVPDEAIRAIEKIFHIILERQPTEDKLKGLPDFVEGYFEQGENRL